MLVSIKKMLSFGRKEKKRLEKQKKEEEQKENKWILLLILLLFIILLGLLIGISFSKYQSEIVGNLSTNIAKPVLQITREQSLLLTALEPRASYVFEVKNYQENQINEVEMEYYIEIISHTDEAIKFDLYKENEKITLKDNKTKKINLVNNKMQTDSYRLEITYDSAKGTQGKDINENVEIKIHSIQKG